ncbi:MAG: glutaminyl-peptide cyclotransferase [Deinococcus-Thermus bacterium]|jgi:glutamine cyclotransferase|nr:glutaminyl-peptide cyclotransferase [Deinococcota bacterium]
MTARATRPAAPLLLGLLLSLALIACGSAPPRELQVEEVARYPHDAGAFTQGLLWHDGALYESTGLYGRSSLRRVRLGDGEVRAIRYLPDDVFGEGLARVGDELVQLTWRAGVAYRWPVDGFERGEPPLETHVYEGEGWGLCHDGARLVMSDGSATLTFRDPATFAVLDTVTVALDGEPLARLNELACVGDAVWANVWQDDRIVRIDPSDGRVTAWLDLADLLPDAERERLGPDAVLNGIAWREDTETLLVTGKLWPVLVELRLAGGP